MEVSGLVLAVAGLIDPLIRLGYHTSRSQQRSSSFGVDAERLRVRLRREKRQVEAIRRLLLTKAEGLGLSATVFEQFDDLWQADLLDELRQLRALTRELEEIEDRYHVFNAGGTGATQSQPPTAEIVNLALADDREAALQRAATKSQLMRWGFKDAKRTAKILDDLHKWVELFKEDVQMCLWTCFKTTSKLGILRQNTDVAALGLSDAVELRRILIETVDPTAKNLEIKSAPQTGARLSANSVLGMYHDRPAFIEFKSYDPGADATVSERITFQVCQLVALLSRPQRPEAGPSLRILQCAGYYVEPAESRYSFVYTIPADLKPEPVSLLGALTAGEQRYRSTIRHRLKLAYTLSLSIYHLHLVGWVHKSFRSENILFFPTDSLPATVPAVNAPSSLVAPDVLVDRHSKDHYVEPWLVGFEFSRVISQNSDLASTDTSIAKNIYRHPARWNAPTHRFGPIHDIYALGTVLLEIGIWKPLISLSDSGFARAADAATSTDAAAAAALKDSVKAQLLQHAVRKLPFTLGRVYCEVVELCLSGISQGSPDPWGFGVDENDYFALGRAFREKVVEPLGKAAASL